jgi:hypothetical protein
MIRKPTYLLGVLLFSAFFFSGFMYSEQASLNESGFISENFGDIVNVNVSGSEGNYTFSVTISSPDTGCDQYANWWEVISEDGELIYRRILGHSHVGGPFTRSGGPVQISSNTVVWVRAHMNNTGYGANEGVMYRGTVDCGFKATPAPPDFALDIELDDPQPEECPF